MNVSTVVAVVPLVALLWEQPWLLLWSAAAALPWLIHLLSRRRYQSTPWAAMEFLLAAARRQSRRVRLENWLLLLLRTLIVLLFVAAVAAPYRETSQPVAPPNERMHTIFVLDGSFSMGQTAGGRTLFDAAKDQIVRYVDRDDRRDDAFSLVLMAAPARAIVASPSTDRQAFADAVNALELPHGRADLPGAVALASNMLADAPRVWPPLSRQEVVFLTDLGRNTWGRMDATLPGDGDAASTQLAPLAGKADLRLVELGARSASNLAVTRLALGESLPLAGAEIPVSATVRNYSDAPRNDVVVELLADGRRIEQRALGDLAPRGEATVAFSYRFAAVGRQSLEARIAGADDGLDIDNHRWLVVSVRDALRTLCVSGKPGAAEFVAIAVAPNSPSSAIFQANVVPPGVLRSGLALDDYDAVAMCNVPPLGNEEARRLGDFVRRGGGLIWFLGDMVDASAYNAMTASDQAGLLPASVVQPSPWGAYTIDPLEFAHAILEPFRGQQDTTLARTPIQRYFRLASRDDSAAETFLRIADTGDPLAVAGSFGAGRVVVFATDGSLSSVDAAAGEPWTYWPVWQSFVPVVQETLRFVVGGRSAALTTTVGLPLGGTLAPSFDAGSVVVWPPNANDGRPAATFGDADGRKRWEFADTSTSGIYRVTTTGAAGLPPDSADVLAVNVDVAESDPARVARDDLPKEVDVGGELGSPAEASVVAAARDDWHVALVCGLLALVVAESACAWLLGRRMA